MNTCRLYHPARIVLSLIGAVSIMGIASCGDPSVSPQGSTTNKGTDTTVAKGAEVDALPRHGKLAAATAPPIAIFGMVWVNTAENQEYIFDGTQWVPHNQSVDEFYTAQELKAKSTGKTVSLEASEVCEDGDLACTPTGAHGTHGGYDCHVCHNVGGRLAFAKTGPHALAYAAGQPAPSFDAVTKTCSNVACHGVVSGTFNYYFPGGDGEPELKTAVYGGGTSSATPSWYATGVACGACHGNPPKSYNYTWHSGIHGGHGMTGANNQCQMCHPDASSPNNGIGNTITNATLHSNGTLDVQGKFKSTCFGCH